MTIPKWADRLADLMDEFDEKAGVSFFGEWPDFLFCKLTDAETELEQWKTRDIVEIAVRNPSVAEYMGHWEGRATKAEAELARLQWQPITPQNLPRVGDELFGSRTDGRGVHVRLLPEGYTSPVPRVGDFTCAGWTHFRPINPPKETA